MTAILIDLFHFILAVTGLRPGPRSSSMRHLPGEAPPPFLDPVPFTPLFDEFIVDITLIMIIRTVMIRCHNHQYFYRDTIARELPTKAEGSTLPMRQTSPRRMPTRYFKSSGRADRYYTLLKGDLEVAVAKGNLILPRRNSTTGCSLVSYPGHIIIIIIIIVIIMNVTHK